jgi:hypothetical protein
VQPGPCNPLYWNRPSVDPHLPYLFLYIISFIYIYKPGSPAFPPALSLSLYMKDCVWVWVGVGVGVGGWVCLYILAAGPAQPAVLEPAQHGPPPALSLYIYIYIYIYWQPGPRNPLYIYIYMYWQPGPRNPLYWSRPSMDPHLLPAADRHTYRVNAKCVRACVRACVCLCVCVCVLKRVYIE